MAGTGKRRARLLLLAAGAFLAIWWLSGGHAPGGNDHSLAARERAAAAGGTSSAGRPRALPSFQVAPAAAPAPDRAEEPEESGPGAEFMRLYNGQSGRLTNGESFEVRHGPRRMSRTGVPVTVWSTRNELRPGDDTTLLVEAAAQDTRIEEATAELRIGDQVKRFPMSPAGERTFAVKILPDMIPASTPDGDGDTAPPVVLDAVVDVKVQRLGQSTRARVATVVSLEDGGASYVRGSEEVRLTGDGSAALFIDVEVKRAGPYHAYAELWNVSGNTSLAFGRKNLGVLGPGRHRITLLFGGKIIRASGVDGPYAVRNLELLRVTRKRPHSAPPIAQLLITPPWRATEFH